MKERLHKPPVYLEAFQRERAGQRMILEFARCEVELLVLAVMRDHVHGLGRFDAERVREDVGRAKRASSHALRAEIPGVVWAKKCALKTIRDREQQLATYRYIERHRSQGAWVWSFRESRKP